MSQHSYVVNSDKIIISDACTFIAMKLQDYDGSIVGLSMDDNIPRVLCIGIEAFEQLAW